MLGSNFLELTTDLIREMAGVFVSMYDTNTTGRALKKNGVMSSECHACAIYVLARVRELLRQPPLSSSRLQRRNRRIGCY